MILEEICARQSLIKFNQDDAQQQKAREAKNELERLCWNIKSFSFEGVPPSELEKIMEKCNDILEWLQTTRSTDEKEFEQKMEKLRGISAPFLQNEIIVLD